MDKLYLSIKSIYFFFKMAQTAIKKCGYLFLPDKTR